MPVSGGGLTSSPGAVTHKLEADFSGTAFGGSPTWTDITGWWMSAGSDPGGSSATIPWGRQDQSTTVESSTTSFVLNNADGRFTPGKATSPYYPNVKRRVRMRETITDGTTTLTLFDGYVDSWTVTPQTNGPTLATVSLSDGFARLQASTRLRSIYAEEVLRDAPAAFYMLDEATGAISGGNIATTTQPAITVATSKSGGTPPAFGTGLPLPSLPDSTGVLFSGTSATAGGSLVLTPTVTTSTSWTLELWVASAAGSTPVDIVNTFTGGNLQFTTSGSTSGITTSYAPTATPFGTLPITATLTHVVLVVQPGSGSQYVNGVLDGSAAITGSPKMPTQVTVGGLGKTAITRFLSGSAVAVALYPTVLSDPRIAAHYSAGMTAFAGESIAARWARLLTYRPNLGGTTTGTLGAIGSGDITGMSLGDALTDEATAEGGVIQTNRGALALIGRSNWYDPATTLTLNAANGEVDLPTTWRDDTQALVNDVTVSRPNGAAQRVVNTASTTGADGVAETSISANLNTDRDAADMAGWLVAVGVREQIDSPTLTVNLYARSSAVLTMAVCALKTYDVVTLTNLPASAPASAMSFQVQGGTYTVGADTFTAELYTTVMPPTTLRTDATADAYTLLDSGLVFSW